MLSRVACALALALGVGMTAAIANDDELAAFEAQPLMTGEQDPLCGNSVVDPGEICDDGNSIDGDGCSSTCSIDGYAPRGPHCGDATTDDNEECDDGNVESGDGCTSTCDLEA